MTMRYELIMAFHDGVPPFIRVSSNGTRSVRRVSPRSISTPQAAHRKTRSETESGREPLSHFSSSDPEGGFSCESLFERPNLGSVNIVQPSWKIGWSGGGSFILSEFSALSLKTLLSSSGSNFSKSSNVNFSNSSGVSFSISVHPPIVFYEATRSYPQGEYIPPHPNSLRWPLLLYLQMSAHQAR